MSMNIDELNRVSEAIIGRAFTVVNGLGTGFLEKVYENSLAHELRKAGLNVLQQRNVDVWYDGIVVGSYIADLLVEGAVVVELKVAKTIDPSHAAQCLNYLPATGLPLGLILNFGNPRLQIRRIIRPATVPQ